MRTPLQVVKRQARIVRKRWQRPPSMDPVVANVAAKNALAVAELITSGSSVDGDPRPVVPVVMCCWNRLERVPKILRTVEQSLGVRAEVYLWNNRVEAADRLAAELRANADLIPRTSLANSAVNVGGFGRFYWARELAPRHPFVVFIDDDQVVDPFALRTLVDEHRPHTLHAVWAFRFTNRTEYWSRQHVRPGAQAKYLGTGGMIADSTIFIDDALFECPGKYWFIEDLWLSYLAAVSKGWALYRSHADIGLMLDNVGQTSRLRVAKDAFFRELNKDSRWVDLPELEPGGLLPAPRRRPAESRLSDTV